MMDTNETVSPRRAVAALLAALVASATSLAAAGAAPQRQADPPQQQQQEPEPQPVAIAGKWAMSLEMSMGTSSIVLELKQEDEEAPEKVTGTYTGGYGTFPLEGVLKGRALEFAVYMSYEGQELTMWFSGEVAEDLQSMRGGATLGELGDATWSAKPAR